MKPTMNIYGGNATAGEAGASIPVVSAIIAAAGRGSVAGHGTGNNTG